MTKRIKARKRWVKGRARFPGPREPNGRLSRRIVHVEARTQETERAAMQTVIEARQRVFGISEASARQQEGGTVIGRMLQRGELSADQHQTAIVYLEARNAFHSAIDVKSDTGRHPPSETPPVASADDFCANARRRYRDIQFTLQRLCQELRSNAPITALDRFVVRDEFDARLVGDLRVVLNALHRLFNMGSRRAA